MCKKRLLALFTAIVLVCSVSLGAIPFASAETTTKWETKPAYEAALISGQASKLLSDFASEADGVHSFAITDGTAAGFKQLTINPFADGTGSSTADYLQFEIKNPANKPFEMFWFKLYTSAAGYQVQAAAGQPYQFYDYATKTWTDMTIATKATYFDNAACITVPANSEGIVRIPISSFKGCTAGASDENDKYVFGDNLINGLDVYTHIADPDKAYTATMDNLAWVGAPKGFEKAPSYEAALTENQSAKLLSDFTNETNGVHEFAITNGSAGGHQQLTINPFADGTGSSTADYLQFEIKNPANKPFEMFWFKLYTSAAGYQVQAAAGQPYQFYDYATKTWTDMTIATKATYFDNAACITVPANSEGIVRIPISSFKGCTAGASDENDKYVFGDNLINGLDVYTHIADPDKAYTATMDNLAWVMGTPVDSGNDDGNDEYTTTDTVKLNPGEVYKPLTGFETDDLGQVPADNGGTGAVSTDQKNNGSQSYLLTFTDGSPGGHQNLHLNTNIENYNDWSQAKYLQFYVNNTCPEGCNPLQLFYIELGTQKLMLNYDATGIKLYDKSTGKWSDAEVVENSHHIVPDLNSIKCPTLQIPAEFEGYVRIPLTNENFVRGDIEDALSNITTLGMYGLIIGVPGEGKVYFDDFGLVSYTGDTAPDYVDDKIDDGGDDDDNNDNPYEGQTTIFTMTGVLKDQTGKPVSGATVTLNGNSISKTNDKGQFIFNNVSTGYVELTAVGADGADYGYVTFEALTGEATAMNGLNITVAHNTKGITIDIGMDELGLVLSGVTEGIIEGLVADDDSNSSDSDNSTPDEDNSAETGVTTAAAAAVVIMISASVAVILIQKKRMQNK